MKYDVEIYVSGVAHVEVEADSYQKAIDKAIETMEPTDVEFDENIEVGKVIKMG